MIYASELAPVFLKLLGKLDKQVKERVLGALEEILKDPRRGSRLIFAQQVYFRWRVGDRRKLTE